MADNRSSTGTYGEPANQVPNWKREWIGLYDTLTSTLTSPDTFFSEVIPALQGFVGGGNVGNELCLIQEQAGQLTVQTHPIGQHMTAGRNVGARSGT